MAKNNYITPVGLQRIQYEIQWLRKIERPRIVAEVSWAASLGDRSENAEYIYGKKRLRQIDGRTTYLVRCLDHVHIIDPALVTTDKVVFGATVVVADEEGVEKSWRIYGEHEVDIADGILSHKSPLARALQGKAAGDEVVFAAPGGRREMEIISVTYVPQDPVPVPQWKLDLEAE